MNCGSAWIDTLLENGHRCPACGGEVFATLQLNTLQPCDCREPEPAELARDDQRRDWFSPPEDRDDDFRYDLMLGTVKVNCAGCGFLLWSILPDLEKLVATLQENTPLRPADAEGRTTW